MANLELIKNEIRGFMPQMKMILGDEAKVSQYATALQQLAFNPNLKGVDVKSVLQVGFEIVRAGLNPNPLFGQAYVVPFKGKAQLQIGYKGWIALGYRYGWKFRAVAVYKCDEFQIEFNGLTDKIHFNPNWDERKEDDGAWVFNNLKGVIVYAKDSYNNEFTEFVSFKKLEKIRQKSQNQVSNKLQYIWLEWAEEMYKAKALKYVITRLPIQEEIMNVATKEDEVFRDLEDKKPQIEKTVNNNSNTMSLADLAQEQNTEDSVELNWQEVKESFIDAFKKASPETKAQMVKVKDNIFKGMDWQDATQEQLKELYDAMF